MKPSEIMFDKKISNRDKFGVYVKARRIELGMTVRDLANALNFSPAYISDIENGNRAAPLKHLKQVARLLKIDKEEIDAFYDIAGCAHLNWPDINEYLAKIPNARKAIRLARDMNLSEQEFLQIISIMASENEQTDECEL